MLNEHKRTLGFFCPHCRQAVIVERTGFQLLASQCQIDCPCGKSSLHIQLQEDKVEVRTPCLYCEDSHTLHVPATAFVLEKAIAFSCGVSGLDCAYVGEEDAVFAAMRRLEESLDHLPRPDAETEADTPPSTFLNDIVMEEILEELRDIGARGGIACACGKQQFDVQVQYSAVVLTCTACHGSLKIPAATIDDIEDLCCKTTLTIPSTTKPL